MTTPPSKSERVPEAVFIDDAQRVMVADDPSEPCLVREYVPADELERLRARVLHLESLGAVTAVAGPLQRAINEAARLLSAALVGHEAGERTFRRGELADLEAALDVLHKVRSHA